MLAIEMAYRVSVVVLLTLLNVLRSLQLPPNQNLRLLQIRRHDITKLHNLLDPLNSIIIQKLRPASRDHHRIEDDRNFMILGEGFQPRFHRVNGHSVPQHSDLNAVTLYVAVKRVQLLAENGNVGDGGYAGGVLSGDAGKGGAGVAEVGVDCEEVGLDASAAAGI